MTRRLLTRCNKRVLGVMFFALVFVSSSFAAEEKKVEPKLKEFDARYLQSPKSGPRLEDVAKKIIDLTNEFRKAEGRGQLSVNKKLTQAAQYIAAYMAQTGQFSHEADGNRPADRVKLFGY